MRPRVTEAASARRRHELDALRGFAMLLGIGLHASLSFFPAYWPVQDSTSGFDGLFDEFFHAVHGFRVLLFFLLSGFFTTMSLRRRGLGSMLAQRAKRIAVPTCASSLDRGDVAMLRYWFTERTLWLADVFGEPEPAPPPALPRRSESEGTIVGVDLRTDPHRRHGDADALACLLGR
jgi:hypothetical protein